jgi:hypothetical protein
LYVNCSQFLVKLALAHMYTVMCDFRGEDLNTYMIQFGEVILSNWNNVGSLCGGGILLLVSVNDSLVKFQISFSSLDIYAC